MERRMDDEWIVGPTMNERMTLAVCVPGVIVELLANNAVGQLFACYQCSTDHRLALAKTAYYIFYFLLLVID